MTFPVYDADFTVDAANLTRYASNATGATWTLAQTTTADGLAHFVVITNDSATDHSAKTAIITGTDGAGVAQTETVNLPGVSGTVTSTKLFKTVTSVVPSATIGADTMDIGISAIAATGWIKVDSSKDIGVAVDIGGTINYDIEVCYEEPAIGASRAFDHASFTAKTADIAGVIAHPVNAVRVYVNSHTSGTFTFQVLQGTRD